jgi:transposase
MESTGQYWRPIWNILEGEVPKLVLVNPTHVKALAGRKTDRIDSQRLARYLESRELDGSFVPPRGIRELRDLTRARVHLLQEVNRVKNRIGQMCEAGNIKISSVASDLFGVSGKRMLQAIVEGKRDPGWMADYARGSLRTKRRELQQALDGTFTEHQRWMLQAELRHLDWLEGQITKVEKEIAVRMQPYQEMVLRLGGIPGVDRIVAWTMVAELGPDMEVFPSADHVVSWAGMCPGNCESGGKRKRSRTRKANPYLRRALCQAAWAASHAQDSYLAAMYRRLRGRLGHNQAIFAVAHQILRIAYTMLRRGEDYRELGIDYYDRRNEANVVRRTVQRLTRLGYRVSVEKLDTPAAVEPTTAIAVSTESPWEATPVQGPEVVTPERVSSKPRRGRPCKCAERGILCSHGGKNREAQKIQMIDGSGT